MLSFFNTANTAKRKNIFISYRVHDTAGETGRLVDTLKASFYEDQIFMDIEKLQPGVDFSEVIAKSLNQCDIMLAVIGPGWKGEVAGTAKSRISQQNDWVRLELSTALQRNITVIPVLVNGGVLPEPEELPEDLQPLLRRQTYEISNKRWKYDTDQLVQFLIKSGVASKTTEPPKKPASKMSTGIKILIGGLAMLGLLAVIGLLMPKEEKTGADYTEKKENNASNNSQQNDNATNENYYQTNDHKTQEPEQQKIADANIAGTWNESNGLYTMIITQSGKSISAQSYAVTGAQTGEGSGSVNGENLTLNMNIAGTGYIEIRASVSADGSILTGNYHIENNGASYTEPLKLVKQY